jgi:hypothetical protein
VCIQVSPATTLETCGIHRVTKNTYHRQMLKNHPFYCVLRECSSAMHLPLITIEGDDPVVTGQSAMSQTVDIINNLKEDGCPEKAIGFLDHLDKRQH